MAKFSAECIKKMNEIVKTLSSRLGADTESLKLRVGLHTGPGRLMALCACIVNCGFQLLTLCTLFVPKVTAGVLRGQKSRFQLFGDSVNTAARMESTGEPDRIQASQSTADQLIKWNRGLWLEKRPDKVVAKGKGELQT